MASVCLLETTLRDGSYEVDFQFSPLDTAFIVHALDRAGVRYIELCDGRGIGVDKWTVSSAERRKRAAYSDEEHLAAAQQVAERASIGVVITSECTPVEYLKILPRYNAKFVRLAVTPKYVRTRDCLSYIQAAKDLGLTVSLNLMQSYVLSV